MRSEFGQRTGLGGGRLEPMTPSDRFALFRSLHHTACPLVLPNAWDVASARLVEQAGAAAVATTSAGVAWSLGAPDGGRLDRDLALAAVARIVRAVRVPVTADVEDGLAADVDGLAETMRGVLATGAVGVNIEDADHSGAAPLLPVERQVERLTAARKAAGPDLFINARVDSFLRQRGEPEDLLRDALARAGAYAAAGADGIFVPGVTDPALVARLVAGVPVPLNIMAGSGAPSPAQLADLGVARVSVGSSIAHAAYGVVRDAARALLSTGAYPDLSRAPSYGELNDLFARP
jgi:2-methylisocitrate lyase-like PEP mutase family enzyme